MAYDHCTTHSYIFNSTSGRRLVQDLLVTQSVNIFHQHLIPVNSRKLSNVKIPANTMNKVIHSQLSCVLCTL